MTPLPGAKGGVLTGRSWRQSAWPGVLGRARDSVGDPVDVPVAPVHLPLEVTSNCSVASVCTLE